MSESKLLRDAIENNDIAEVKTILNKGIFSNLEEYDPLSHAVHMGHVEIVQLLLDAKLDPNAHGVGDLPPICLALTKEAIIRILLTAGADVNHIFIIGTPLWFASKFGYKSAVRLFMEAGGDPYIQHNGKNCFEIAGVDTFPDDTDRTPDKIRAIINEFINARERAELEGDLTGVTKKRKGIRLGQEKQ